MMAEREFELRQFFAVIQNSSLHRAETEYLRFRRRLRCRLLLHLICALFAAWLQGT
jgi:hypothetical protein